jgi:hypothetical protein
MIVYRLKTKQKAQKHKDRWKMLLHHNNRMVLGPSKKGFGLVPGDGTWSVRWDLTECVKTFRAGPT